MSIRTTITLDDDVVARLKEQSASKGTPFRRLVNDVIRKGLEASEATTHAPLKLRSHPAGLRPGLSYDDIEALIEVAEGPLHR